MLGRETPKPLQSSLRCGWPELSIGKTWELVIEHAGLAGWAGVGRGFFLALCRNIHSVVFTGVLTWVPSFTLSCCSLCVCQQCDAFCISVMCYSCLSLNGKKCV